MKEMGAWEAPDTVPKTKTLQADAAIIVALVRFAMKHCPCNFLPGEGIDSGLRESCHGSLDFILALLLLLILCVILAVLGLFFATIPDAASLVPPEHEAAAAVATRAPVRAAIEPPSWVPGRPARPQD
ncbi:unnamed protein product [Prorocentrum cordatum]|uniref:Uncharacterized protein n=1 Tax=Prorocentrum cordatum TaxID=2364126 RepID=A0ABN9PTF2_9DINO|nr:unnamed protein product [Polarella glacialis]|mmetsp:Transcript_17890/g.47950  ORF Transcript_17890/g.47950 Transcript_17890/m.47950 type:complete len:128 (+) Transcript_17890:447-830(+)